MAKFSALLIDDNPKNLGVLAQMITMEGGEYTKVSQPQELEAIWKTLPRPDMIFLDLEMPTTDGYTILQAIKAEPRFKGVPVIAYTVHVSEINVAHQHGFDGFIGKPLNADKFPEQIARILNGEGVWETV